MAVKPPSRLPFSALVTMGHLKVIIGHLWVTVGHPRVTIGHPRVTIGHLRVTMGHLRLTIGYLKATVVHIRVTLGHLKVTLGHLRVTTDNFISISKHKANTTELHPKVRQTCYHFILGNLLQNIIKFKILSTRYEAWS